MSIKFLSFILRAFSLINLTDATAISFLSLQRRLSAKDDEISPNRFIFFGSHFSLMQMLLTLIAAFVLDLDLLDYTLLHA